MAQSMLLQKPSASFLVKILRGHGQAPSHWVWQQSPIKGKCWAVSHAGLGQLPLLPVSQAQHAACRVTYSPASLLQLEHVIGKSKMILFGRILFSPKPKQFLETIRKSMPVSFFFFFPFFSVSEPYLGSTNQEENTVIL